MIGFQVLDRDDHALQPPPAEVIKIERLSQCTVETNNDLQNVSVQLDLSMALSLQIMTE